MTKLIAINGFGRIGRAVFRIINERIKQGNNDLMVGAINDLASIETMAYLLKYDSVHGQFKGDVKVINGKLLVDNNFIKVYSTGNLLFQ